MMMLKLVDQNQFKQNKNEKWCFMLMLVSVCKIDDFFNAQSNQSRVFDWIVKVIVIIQEQRVLHYETSHTLTFKPLFENQQNWHRKIIR